MRVSAPSSSSPLFGELLQRLGLVTSEQVQEALSLQSVTNERVGEALVRLGHVTREQLQLGLSEALGLNLPSAAPRPPLGELLVGLKHVTAAQRDEALLRQRRDGRKLGEILVELGHCSYKQVYEALALQQRVRGDDAPAAQAPHAGPGDGARRRVMVVDDSAIACAVVQEGLVGLGYEVVCFQDPFEALEQVPRVQPALVLSDLEMPGLDGVALCGRLKEGAATRGVPVIILTANDMESRRVQGLRAGADDYIHKGASLEELSARIESVVRRTGETARMRRLFARYTSDAVVEEILQRPGDVVLTGERREVTVLFADLRNFTALAEMLSPERTVAVLNHVLGALSDAVLTCGGTLDKFLGDGLMAVFGAPVARADDALRALQAARMMVGAIEQLNAQPPGELFEAGSDLPALQLGVGINSGQVVVGTVGSALRTEYTCIGDAVNVASRLCALAAPGEVLVGARTQELGGGGGAGARFEPLPAVQLKGRSQPVLPYRAL